MTKIIIANRDPEDQDETREIAPVALDLDFQSELDEPNDAPPVNSPDFSPAIAQAACDALAATAEENDRENRRRAHEMLKEGLAALAENIKSETGFSSGMAQPFIYKAKPKPAYNLWKRVIPAFIDIPRTLDEPVTALAKRLDENEPNFTITRDMMYDRLNDRAVGDLKELLRERGITLKLKPPVHIASVRSLLIQRRDEALVEEVEAFECRCSIRGETATINGKPYKVQYSTSGARRVKRNGRWLYLDVLKDFCSK